MVIQDFLHYSSVEPGTSGERTVFGKPQKGLEYVYDDRLCQWDWKAHERAKKVNKEKPHTSEYYEKYLSLYYKKPVKLVHMLLGVNVSNGYHYHVYGFLFISVFEKIISCIAKFLGHDFICDGDV